MLMNATNADLQSEQLDGVLLHCQAQAWSADCCEIEGKHSFCELKGNSHQIKSLVSPCLFHTMAPLALKVCTFVVHCVEDCKAL